MAGTSSIEWTDASWNPIRARETRTGKIGWHCEHKSEGCRFCYAENINKRLGTGLEFKPGLVRKPFSEVDGVEIFLDETSTGDASLIAPLRWRKPRMIFVCSMTDLFADFVPDEFIDKMFAVMALCPQHTFQVLTKRPERMREYLTGPARHNTIELAAEAIKRGPEPLGGKHVLPQLPLPNIWLGVSAERQQEADERIPLLLATPAVVRFVSLEPLLGPIYLTEWLHNADCDIAEQGIAGTCTCSRDDLNWAIVGGESGPNARPMHPDWARSLRDQCAAADVPYFFKQWGGWKNGSDFADDAHIVLSNGQHFDQKRSMEDIDREVDGVMRLNPTMMRRVGKKAAGRLLDGRENNALPTSHPRPAA